MPSPEQKLEELAYLVLEAFSHGGPPRPAFDRAWELIGPVERMAEHSQNTLQHAFVLAAADILEDMLATSLHTSTRSDAAAVAFVLSSGKAPAINTRIDDAQGRLSRLRHKLKYKTDR